MKSKVELCWIIVGQRRGPIWLGRKMRRISGERSSVAFDAAWVLQREESRHDVVGFWHTHPDGPDSPSSRDVRTMRAWCSAFGKPLLCVIQSPNRITGYCFHNDESEGMPLPIVESFARGVLVGVEIDGGQVSS
jgi:proteasome lid subunit RPN8/RPN11